MDNGRTTIKTIMNMMNKHERVITKEAEKTKKRHKKYTNTERSLKWRSKETQRKTNIHNGKQ